MLENFKKHYEKFFRKTVENEFFEKISLFLIDIWKPVEMPRKFQWNSE